MMELYLKRIYKEEYEKVSQEELNELLKKQSREFLEVFVLEKIENNKMYFDEMEFEC